MSINLYKVHFSGDPLLKNQWMCEYCTVLLREFFSPAEAQILYHEEPLEADKCPSCGRVREVDSEEGIQQLEHRGITKASNRPSQT